MGMITTRKLYFLLMIFIFFILTNNAWGEPSIQSVSGELIDGSTLIISGNLFGKHDSYGGSDNFLPYLWETFDDPNPYITNPKITSGYAQLESTANRGKSKFYLKHQRISSQINYTTFRGQKVALSTMYNCKIPVSGLSPMSEYFFSGWFMTKNIETLTDNDSNQLKILDASPLSNNYKIYFNLEGYAGYPRYSTAIESNDTGNDVPVSTSTPDGTWHRFDIYLSVPVAKNSYTDVVKFWIDGRLLRVGHQVGNLYSSVNDVQPIDAIYFNNWINNSSNSPFYILSDDAFVDFTQARVEISESSVWDETVQVHKELQIPISWEDGVIRVQINQGSMADLSDKFLFVVDENGVASAGFPLSQDNVQKPKTVQGFESL